MLVFGGRGKPEFPEKNLSEKSREPETHVVEFGIEPRPHQWKVSAPTSQMRLHPSLVGDAMA